MKTVTCDVDVTVLQVLQGLLLIPYFEQEATTRDCDHTKSGGLFNQVHDQGPTGSDAELLHCRLLEIFCVFDWYQFCVIYQEQKRNYF